MTLDKSNSTTEKDKIVLDWERTKKQAKKKVSELVCNAPKISKREELEVLKKQSKRLVPNTETGRSSTTDIIINPIEPNNNNSQRLEANHNHSLEPNQKSGNDFYTDTIDIDNNNIDQPNNANQSNNNNTFTNNTFTDNTFTEQLLTNNTSTEQLLAAPPVQEESSEKLRSSERSSREVIEIGDRGVITSDQLGPDSNAIDLLKQIKNGEVVGKDLAVDERQIVVKALRMAGQTQDAISSLLQVSRRTIVTDCKRLRELAALEIQSTETAIIAGEVYTTARAAINKALQKGHLKTVSTLMRDMVELLQSMGMVYRAPKTSMQASIHGTMNRSKGYQKYIDTIGQDNDKVVEVLDCMFNAIDNKEI